MILVFVPRLVVQFVKLNDLGLAREQIVQDLAVGDAVRTVLDFGVVSVNEVIDPSK